MLDLVMHWPLRLQADASRVVVRPFHIPIESKNGEKSRPRRIVEGVLGMGDDAAQIELTAVLKDFEARHWQTRSVFKTRYAEISNGLKLDDAEIPEVKQQLIGAFFCHEYSYAAAAIMNPSIVRHPDQSGLSEGSSRIVMSLRTVGEGHISSIAFREGILSPGARFELAPEPPFATAVDGA